MAAPAASQSFSCRGGTTPACLEFGDQVCASSGKCVNERSVCYDPNQCDGQGFTCRSAVTRCVDRHEALVKRFNDLVGRHNDLLDELDDIEFCLRNASTLAQAKSC